MLLVFVPGLGIELNGARRWIELGNFTIQPSEFFKLSLIIYLASFFFLKIKQKLIVFPIHFCHFLS